VTIFYKQKTAMVFENHIHLSLHKFNSHFDNHKDIHVKKSNDHLHKHKHDGGKEHEHSHPLILELKEFIAFNVFKVNFKKFVVDSSLTAKVPVHLSSDYTSEILRPPIC
jgi:ABC-type Zn2+ transport system substrate-binding protein/surface adhesin